MMSTMSIPALLLAGLFPVFLVGYCISRLRTVPGRSRTHAHRALHILCLTGLLLGSGPFYVLLRDTLRPADHSATTAPAAPEAAPHDLFTATLERERPLPIAGAERARGAALLARLAGDAGATFPDTAITDLAAIDDPSTDEVLAQLLARPEPRLRRCAADAAAKRNTMALIDPLVVAARAAKPVPEKSPEMEEARQAAHTVLAALAKTGSSRAVGPLLDHLFRMDADLSRTAAQGLRLLGSPVASKTLRDNLANGRIDERVPAAAGLGFIYSTENQAALVTALEKDASFNVRAAAATSLGRYAFPNLVPMLEVRLAAEAHPMPKKALEQALTACREGRQRALSLGRERTLHRDTIDLLRDKLTAFAYSDSAGRAADAEQLFEALVTEASRLRKRSPRAAWATAEEAARLIPMTHAAQNPAQRGAMEATVWSALGQAEHAADAWEAASSKTDDSAMRQRFTLAAMAALLSADLPGAEKRAEEAAARIRQSPCAQREDARATLLLADYANRKKWFGKARALARPVAESAIADELTDRARILVARAFALERKPVAAIAEYDLFLKDRPQSPLVTQALYYGAEAALDAREPDIARRYARHPAMGTAGDSWSFMLRELVAQLDAPAAATAPEKESGDTGGTN